MRAEKYSLEIHNMTSHNRGGRVVLKYVAKCDRGWVSKNAKISVT